ncbi:MAG: ABC transporter ATP-binding protein [Candidatus Goldbacteria bacterium]|nr:ABC transporter ATP-binding protein [Candidatus Goldiibacteriota bacterium]
MNILEIKNLTLKKDNRILLDNINIEIWAGYVHAIVGPNGAGKSTLANTIMGLSGYRDFSGDILYEGRSIKNLSIDERARLGITLVFQEPARFEGLPVDDFILAGVKDKKTNLIDEALLKVGLDPIKYRQRSVDKTLSGGERKRIELASIYAMKPKLVFLDEPDSGVDIDSVKYIFEIIKEFKKNGTTVILVTHSQEVLKQSDHGFLLCAGKLICKGEVNKLFEYFTGKCAPCNHVGKPDKE